MTHPVQLPIQAKKQDKRVMRVKVGSNGEKKELDKIWKIGGGGGGVDNLGREEGGTMGGIPSHYLQIYKIPQIKCRPFLEFPAPFSLR